MARVRRSRRASGNLRGRTRAPASGPSSVTSIPHLAGGIESTTAPVGGATKENRHEDRGDRRQRAHRQEARASPQQQGHEAVPASPSSGVNALTGEGLAEALTGAQVVVDVSNSP